MRVRSSSSMLEPSSLLVRGVNWLGDAVMTTPALHRLRERLPRSRIVLLTHEKLADLWQHHPSINSVVTFRTGEYPWSIARRLRTQNFEAGLLLPNSPRSAFELWLARVPHRIGYTGPWRDWLLTHPVQRPGDRRVARRRTVAEVKNLVGQATRPENSSALAFVHQIHDYLALAAALEANPEPVPPRLELSGAEVESTLAQFATVLQRAAPSTSATVYCGLNPSAAYGPAKRWPIERFAEVADVLSRQLPGCVWLVFGSDADSEICEQLARRLEGQRINLAGKTSLRQLMVLLKQCRVLLTNDSGPMHVAAALGTPVVALFGSTSRGLTGPGQPGDPRHQLLRGPAPCAPCFRRTCPIDFRCMTGISVEQVVQAMLVAIKRADRFRAV